MAQQLGPEAAAQPMEVTIPADTELATRADLDSLRSELHRSFLPLVGLVVAVMSYLTR